MTPAANMHVTDAHRQQYRDQGFFILERAVPEDQLQLIRDTCDQLVREQEAEMDRRGTDELDLSRRDSRYFIFLAFKEHPELADFIFSDLMEDICRATIGDDALLFWEQFVVKGTSGSKKGAFAWHQDAGYVDGSPVPHYVNAWIALDDVSEENGTVRILSYDDAGTHERVEHEVDEATGDRIGYRGEDEGTLVEAPAGSIAVFSSTAFHRSGPNTSGKPRRAYALQFAERPVPEADGSVMGLEEWFLRDGPRVR